MKVQGLNIGFREFGLWCLRFRAFSAALVDPSTLKPKTA